MTTSLLLAERHGLLVYVYTIITKSLAVYSSKKAFHFSVQYLIFSQYKLCKHVTLMNFPMTFAFNRITDMASKMLHDEYNNISQNITKGPIFSFPFTSADFV